MTTNSIFQIVAPSVITILGNIIFYLFIKGKIDKSIELYKISYSGVFKERIDVYREILNKLYLVKTLMLQYHLTGDKEEGNKFTVEITGFINFYLKNQPFLSDIMIKKLKNFQTEVQSVFNDSHQFYYLSPIKLEPKMREEITLNFFEAGNKYKTNSPFSYIEKQIIKEMKNDLNTDRKISL